jgi:hypothetical protein
MEANHDMKRMYVGEIMDVNARERGIIMAMVHIIEVIAESSDSWESAAREAVKEASVKFSNIQSIYIENQQAIVNDSKIVKFRVNAKISYLEK